MPANSEKKQTNRFQKGQSGNPKGKPKGTRNRTTLAVEALLDGQAEDLTQIAIDKRRPVIGGRQTKGKQRHEEIYHMTALRLCLDRNGDIPSSAIIDGAKALSKAIRNTFAEVHRTSPSRCAKRGNPPTRPSGCQRRRCQAAPFACLQIEEAADSVSALSAILAAVVAGDITPGEGQTLATLIETHRRTLETADIECRLSALEKERRR